MLQEVKGDGHTMVNSDTRLCSSNAMRDAATNLVCKACAVESREKGIVSYADGFEKYIAKHASKTDYKVAKKLLDAYRIQAKKSEIRQREIFKKNTSVTLEEETWGIATTSKFWCNTKCHPSIPLVAPCNTKTYTSHNCHKSILDYDANIYAIIDPFITGSGPREASLRYSLHDLPSSRNLRRTISRHQSLVGSKIQAVCQNEMQLALELEVKETMIHEHGDEYYNNWKSKKIGARDKVGLTVSYDMGWNKRSSGHRYDSISGHAFIIGAYTRRIIGSVVFSKSCAVCNQRKKQINMQMSTG